MRLRRRLGDRDRAMPVTKAPGYRLVFDPARLDAYRFETLQAEGQSLFAAGAYGEALTVLGDALAPWRGPAMEDVPASPTVRTEAERLEEARPAAAELRIDASHRIGAHTDTLAELRALRERNPLREGLWEKEMTALLASGRRAEALEVYHRARRTFQEELGLEPGAVSATSSRPFSPTAARSAEETDRHGSGAYPFVRAAARPHREAGFERTGERHFHARPDAIATSFPIRPARAADGTAHRLK